MLDGSRSDDVIGLPRLVEERLERPIEAEQHEPALAGHGLDPVTLVARRGLRSELHVDRAIRIRLRLRVGADRWERLGVAQDRAAVGVVRDDRPEQLRRDAGRNMQAVASRAVEELAVAIAWRPQVLRACADVLD